MKINKRSKKKSDNSDEEFNLDLDFLENLNEAMGAIIFYEPESLMKS